MKTIRTSKGLAVELARAAEAIRARVSAVLASASAGGELRKLYKALREALIHDLSEDDFADIYAQTIACGLLSASISEGCNVPAAERLKELVSNTSPLLEELMQTFLATKGRKRPIGFDEAGINEVLELLRRTQLNEVLNDFRAKNPHEDPLIHFYELFLKEYDPQKRMKRGVFYTPRAVVSFIVRSADEILRTEFGLEDGLADTTTWGEFVERERSRQQQSEVHIPEGVSPQEPFVQILDPATGTGTFLVEVIERIYANMRAKWKRQGKNRREMRDLWNEYVPRHLLPRLHGFELMLAPYAIAHMKVSLKLRETHYSFLSSERARIYLTNALEEPKDFPATDEQTTTALADETEGTNQIKRRRPMTVVIGNPPYSIFAANLTASAKRLVNRYRYIDGVRLKEKGALKAEVILQDDYVKFISAAQGYIERSSRGLIGIITNSNFYLNPTLRGMRWSLINSFDSLYLLDLGGQSKSGRTGDENVFEIETGVAVSFFARSSASRVSRIKAGRLHANREAKYAQLSKSDMQQLASHAITPRPAQFLLKSYTTPSDDAYSRSLSIDDIFTLTTIGIKTARDHLAADFERPRLESRLRSLLEDSKTDEFLIHALSIKENTQWSFAGAREQFRTTYSSDNYAVADWRPFDTRWIYFHPSIVFNTRPTVNKHVFEKRNLCLLATRRIRTQSYNHFFVTKRITMGEILSSADNCNIFPLYSYGAKSLSEGRNDERSANLSEKFVARFCSLTGLEFRPQGGGDLLNDIGPEDVFHYIYALFHAPVYRRRYEEYLKDDFPRVPLTSDLNLIRKFCALGADLVAVHLLEDDYAAASWNSSRLRGASPLRTFITRLAGEGGAEVARGYPKYKEGGVFINPSRYFEGVPEEVWKFRVGGYQVCEKWLKDRRGRTLTGEEGAHYQRVVVALKETIRLMDEVDLTIEEHGGWPLAGSGESETTETSAPLFV